MKLFRECLFVTLAVAVGLALVAGCSTQTKRYWLNVFFEGVPPERTNGVASAQTPALAPVRTNAQPVQPERPSGPPLVIHAVYAQRKCNSCHESTYSPKTRSNLGEVCLGCHKGLLPEGKSWHAPAASGECLVCHQPHDSQRKFLLAQAPNILCSQCHEPAEMAAARAHKGKEKADCTECHNPHQGEGEFLLRNKTVANPAGVGSQPTREVVPAMAQTDSTANGTNTAGSTPGP